MKKLLFFIIVLGAIGIGLMTTCPTREDHLSAIKDVSSKVVNSEIDKSVGGALASIGTPVAVKAIVAYLQSNLIIKDYYVLNIGGVDYEGEFRIVSVGICNHVFTVSEEDAKKLIKDKLTLPKL